MKNSVHRLLVVTCFSMASSYSVCIVANPTDLMLPKPLIMTQAQTADDYDNQPENANPQPSQSEASTNSQPSQPEASSNTQSSQPEASSNSKPSQPEASFSTQSSQPQASPSTLPSPPQTKANTQPSQPEDTTKPQPITHPKMYPSLEPEFYQAQPNTQTSENQPSTQTSDSQPSSGQQNDYPSQSLHPKPAKNWAVKVGRFSTVKDTNKTVALLQKHGFDGFVKEIKSNDNQVMEVYVGPTQQRSQAESLNKKLQKSHISGRVVTTEYDSSKSTNDQ